MPKPRKCLDRAGPQMCVGCNLARSQLWMWSDSVPSSFGMSECTEKMASGPRHNRQRPPEKNTRTPKNLADEKLSCSHAAAWYRSYQPHRWMCLDTRASSCWRCLDPRGHPPVGLCVPLTGCIATLTLTEWHGRPHPSEPAARPSGVELLQLCEL